MPVRVLKTIKIENNRLHLDIFLVYLTPIRRIKLLNVNIVFSLPNYSRILLNVLFLLKVNRKL